MGTSLLLTQVRTSEKKAYARRKEEERWVKAAGEVKTVYRCICDKNLEMFKAAEHLKRIKTT